MFKVQLNSNFVYIQKNTTAWKLLSYVMKIDSISQANIYFVKVAVSVIVVKHDSKTVSGFMYLVDLFNGWFCS